MKILKYIFLLVLLGCISLCVFIATQKGTFTVERTSIIHATKINTFNYVNDSQNWEDFMAFNKEKSSNKSRFSTNSVGIGAYYLWTGAEENGFVQTYALQQGDSISQKMTVDGTDFTTTWFFKDTVGRTKVTMKTKGEMSFSYKIYTALHGGAGSVIGVLLEKSLYQLDKNLDYEINSYKINVEGIVQKLGTPYLKQTFNSKLSAVIKNSRIVFPKLIAFCEQNNIERNGKPFIMYHSYDTAKGLAKISLCIPIKEAIITSEGSDILADELKPFIAIKTTLKGDYSHRDEVLKKSKAYLNQKVIQPDSRFSHIEVFTIGKKDNPHPSQWKTDSYFPILPKKSVPKVEIKTEELNPTETEITTSEI